MNQLIKDYSSGKISVGDLIEPEVLAKYALKDPDLREWLYNSLIKLIHQAKYVTTDMRKHNIYYVARVYKKALDIVDVNLCARDESP